MRLATVVVSLLWWASIAAAAPGAIVPPGIEAFSAPSDAASKVARLGAGVTVCVLDDASDTGSVYRPPGWLAIRLSSGDVGYVRTEAVDFSAASPTDPVCLRTANPPAEGGVRTRRSVSMSTYQPAPLPSLSPRGFLPLHPVRIASNLAAGALLMNDQAAAQQKIGTTGPLVDFSLGLMIFDMFSISGALGVASPSDNAMFSQVVVPVEGGGNPSTANSTVRMVRYSLALGARTPFWALGQTTNGWVAGALFANVGWAGVNSNRSIANCTDCFVDQLDLSGGAFWRVGVDLALPIPRQVNHAWGFTASYQSYLGNTSLSQELLIGLSWWAL